MKEYSEFPGHREKLTFSEMRLKEVSDYLIY